MTSPPQTSTIVRLLLLAAAAILVACASGRTPAYLLAFKANLRPVLPVNYDQPPVVKRSTPIAYPGVRLQEGEEGHAKMAFTIDETGRVGQYEVIEASHPAFAGYLQHRLNQWRFEPAKKQGKPVAQRFSQRFDFKIGRSSSSSARARQAAPARESDGPRLVDPVDD